MGAPASVPTAVSPKAGTPINFVVIVGDAVAFGEEHLTMEEQREQHDDVEVHQPEALVARNRGVAGVLAQPNGAVRVGIESMNSAVATSGATHTATLVFESTSGWGVMKERAGVPQKMGSW